MAEALSRAVLLVDEILSRLQSSDGSSSSYADSASIPNGFQGAQHRGQQKATKSVGSVIEQPRPNDATNLDMFAKARLAVGVVRQVEEITNSDKLLRCQVQVGEGQQRQIVAGLRRHISKEDLSGRRVAVILNLKAAKLAGEISEGMILAAVQKGEEYEHGELVRPLCPPDGEEAGAPIYLEGRTADGIVYPKECKAWKKLLPFLAVQSSMATFSGVPLACPGGQIKADACMPDGAAIS